jgi:hypothetical protein
MIIWLASYPRSGNTFIRIILNKIFNINTYSIYNDKNDIAAHAETKDIVGHCDLTSDFDLVAARNSSCEYFIKTHKYPLNNEDKVIYIIRDGRESITSYFHYRNSYNNAPPLKDFIEGKIKVGTWSKHIEAWNSLPANKILIIKFEDLIDDTDKIIKDISSFIEKEPMNHDIPTFDELNKINPKFFRSGGKDSFKNLFDENDHLSFWKINHKKMIEYGYIDDIPETFQLP